MADRDTLATTLTTIPRDPPTVRDVTEAAAVYGWFPDPPWFGPVPVPGGEKR